ncbi:MAG: HEPN domain-containing protein [Thermodesulfovibrionia bacterium]|nr:HEPN domain-containing protein [Thermodesulfovibrionia bacterium]
MAGQSKNDLLNADNNLQSDEIPFDTVCFHCQQAAEKLLKAYLIGNNRSYPITHDLFLILEKILPLNKQAEYLRDALSILTPYSVEVRYPDDWFMPSEQDTKEARNAADEVLQWLKNNMLEIFHDS